MKEYRIFTGSIKSYETDLFYQMENKEVYLKFDANTFVFKRMPTVAELKTAIFEMERKKINECLKIRFPIKQELPQEVIAYLVSESITINKIHLYSIQTNNFPARIAQNIVVKKVDKSNYQEFAQLVYQSDSEYGKPYAKQNGDWNYQKFLNSACFEFYLAYIDDMPAGTVTIIKHTLTSVELDAFVVLPQYQRQGVGTAMQSYIMQQHANKELFLIADGYDTPKDMYEKQGYQLQFVWYEGQRVDG